MGVGIKPEALKKILIPAGITLGVILIIGLLIYMLAIPFNILIIGKLYSNIVARIVNLTGINQWLVKGIVIIALIPLIWVIPHLYWGKYKKSARAIALLYFGVFFLSLFFLSKDINFAHSGSDQIKKWYALTPEGVKFYDSAGVDTDYGITLRPVTPEVIRNLKLLQKGDFKPINPANAQFFNPITGAAQVWFYKYPDGNYEFYDKPGYHPITGEPLQAATKNVYLEWKEKQHARLQRRAIDSWEVSIDKRSWRPVSLPDTNWGCNYCTRYYRSNFDGKPNKIKFRWASDNKARLIVNDAIAFDEFWRPYYCTDAPCCLKCCDNYNNCMSSLSVWRELDTSLFSDKQNVIIWEVYQEEGGSGFYVEMVQGEK